MLDHTGLEEGREEKRTTDATACGGRIGSLEPNIQRRSDRATTTSPRPAYQLSYRPPMGEGERRAAGLPLGATREAHVHRGEREITRWQEYSRARGPRAQKCSVDACS